MAVEGRINVRHEDVFSQPILVLSVDAVEDFDKRRAGNVDPQELDKTTGLRLWSQGSGVPVSCPVMGSRGG